MNLGDPLKTYLRILPTQEKALKRIGIETIRDLLYHFPRSYADSAEIEPIGYLVAGQTATVFGQITNLKTKKAFRKKIPMAEARLKDESGSISIIWFHQAYLAKMIEEGSHVRVEGKVSERKGALYFSNPKIESMANLFVQNVGHTLSPVYPETKGLSSNWLHHKIQNIINTGLLDSIEDPIPEEILKKYKLPSLKNSLIYIHTPKEKEHAVAARKRFAFEEIFFIQLEKALSREQAREKNAFIIEPDEEKIEKFFKRFPFSPTKAQREAVSKILDDFTKGYPMSRLLEGDVGSGKTAVAASASYAIVTSRPKNQNFGTLQVAYMAPTEILAQQHFESFIKYFSHLPINIGLITGKTCRKFPSKMRPDDSTEISRSQLLKWTASGEIAVLIGTQTLIQKSVKFKHLALAIVDEQHRFGVNQRQKLASKEDLSGNGLPHLLSMTATPIPRTLALTLYGDLDLTLLDQMPLGRKPIITEVVEPGNRERAYEKIRQELKAGRQLYVICPRIDEPDPTQELSIQAKSVKEEAKRLKVEVFPEYRIGILHSKMKPDDKDTVMNDFKEHKIDILVSTSVVEVGVSVENASLIIIEGAERFGLAQLHQLRGRVIRGTHQPYCFVFTGKDNAKAPERLRALTEAKNGFELAEFDLQNRGAGELAGKKQWGISDLGMEAIKNLKMVEFARNEAQEIARENPELENFPLLKKRLIENLHPIHFE